MKYKTIPIYACIVIEWVNAKGKHTFAICRARCQIELDVSVFFRMWNCSNVNMISDLMNDLCCYCCHCCCCVMVCDDCCDYHTVEWDDRGSATDSIHNHIFVMLTITNVSHSFFFFNNNVNSCIIIGKCCSRIYTSCPFLMNIQRSKTEAILIKRISLHPRLCENNTNWQALEQHRQEKMTVDNFRY